MTRILPLLLVLFCLPVRVYANDIAALWNDVFTAEEQRIIHAMKVDPQTEAALGQGLTKVVAAKGDPQRYEAEKRSFQLEWLGRIKTFSEKYGSGGLSGQQGLNMPGVAEAKKYVPWLVAADAKDWGGKLLPAVMAKLNPYEAGFALAQLQSLTPKEQESMVSKLGWAKFGGYDAEGVSKEMIKHLRKTFAKNIGKAQEQYVARAPTVRGQLEKVQHLLAKVGTPRLPETAAEAGKTFDGGGKKTNGSAAPVVVGGTETASKDPKADPQDPHTWSASRKLSGSLQPAPEVGPGRAAFGVSSKITEIPPPKMAKAGEGAAKSGGGPGFGAILKSPLVAGGIGALALGIAGFMLLGPIGALIGAVIGFAAGRAIAKALT